MTGVTADTNIYISGFEFGGLPRYFIDLAAAGEFRLDISEAILTEILRVLHVKFEWDADELLALEEDIRSYANLISPTQTLDVIKTDLSDNRIIECAVMAQSDFIVSGDARHVLPVGSYAGIRIVPLASFLGLLKRTH